MRPEIHGLSKRTRTSVFAVLVCIFVVVTPVLWLYASGYRFVSSNDIAATSTSRGLVPTGGVYLGTEDGVTVSVDDIVLRGSRFFRNAVYLDGVREGSHRIVVQREGYHTWVKDLSVAPQLVTEAYVLALPSTTTVQVITSKLTTAGAPVLSASSTLPVDIVNSYEVVPSASRAARTLVSNPDFASIRNLFVATSTVGTSSHPTLAGMRDVIDSLTHATDATSTPVTLLGTRNDIELIRQGDDIMARYVGSVARMPYYFCNASLNTCDPRTVIDRQGKEVYDALWYPGSVDAVIMVRADGLFVTEVDPRGGWQNTQPLIRGSGLRAVVSGNVIYAYDGVTVYQIVQ